MFERVAIFTRGIWEEALIACETPTQLTPTLLTRVIPSQF